MKKRKLIIRSNVNKHVGMGHVMRVTNICKKFEKKFQIIFVLDQELSNLSKINDYEKIYLYKKNEIFSKNKELKKLKNILERYKPDLFIIDDYRFDKTIENKIRQYTKLVVIDDLANREHDCDILIDCGWHKLNTYKRYNKLVNKNCKLLLGPKYFPIKNYNFKKKIKNKKLNILIYFGGGNFNNKISKIISVIIQECEDNFNKNFQINLIVGQYNLNFIDNRLNSRFLKIHKSKNNIQKILNESDLKFCAVNSSIFTLNILKNTKNTFLIFLNKNQSIIKNSLNDLGFSHFYSLNEINKFKINNFLKKIKNKNFKINKPKINIDQNGAKRIYDFIYNSLFKKNQFHEVDDSLIYKYLKFRNSINNRKFSIDKKKILFKDHIYWWHNNLKVKKFFSSVNEKIQFFFFYQKIKNNYNIGFLLSKKNQNFLKIINAYKYLLSKLNRIVGHVNIKNKFFIYLNNQFNFKIIKKIKIKNDYYYVMRK